MEPTLTIIVLTYNSSHIIKRCLENLNFEKYKIVVVDNASKDGSAEFVRKNFPKAQVIELPKNIGYGRGNNVALRQVTSDFALILNPDAIIFEKDIEVVLEAMKKNPQIAMAGPVLLEKYPLNGDELKEKISELESNEKSGDNFLVKFLVGAALFMNISIMKKIGFFSEKIFLYYEDDELGFRVKANGYHNAVVPNAVAFHVGGESSGSSLRISYKKGWHLAWSKLYWKEMKSSKAGAKRAAARLTISHFVRAVISLVIGKVANAVTSLGSCAGSFSYLIGREAFNENGDSRG